MTHERLKMILYFPITQRGATMVEAVIGMIVFLAFFGAIIDFGLGFQRYSMLTHTADNTANALAKKFATDISVGNSIDCDRFVTEARNTLHNTFGVSNSEISAKTNPDNTPSNATFRISGSTVSAVPGVSPPRALVNIEMPLSCFFCVFFPRGVTLKASSEAIIENSSFSLSPDLNCT